MEHCASTGRNLSFIMVQLPEECQEGTAAYDNGYETICQIGEDRIRKADLSINTDSLFGMRVLELSDSCFVAPQPGQLLLDRIKPGRSDEDIIFEMMLKWGYELTYPIEKTEVSGYPCYSVAADSLICCMQEGLTVQALQAIADLDPDRVLILDSILDDTLKLNALQIFKRAEERTQKKIDLRTV